MNNNRGEEAPRAAAPASAQVPASPPGTKAIAREADLGGPVHPQVIDPEVAPAGPSSFPGDPFGAIATPIPEPSPEVTARSAMAAIWPAGIDDTVIPDPEIAPAPEPVSRVRKRTAPNPFEAPAAGPFGLPVAPTGANADGSSVMGVPVMVSAEGTGSAPVPEAAARAMHQAMVAGHLASAMPARAAGVPVEARAPREVVMSAEEEAALEASLEEEAQGRKKRARRRKILTVCGLVIAVLGLMVTKALW